MSGAGPSQRPVPAPASHQGASQSMAPAPSPSTGAAPEADLAVLAYLRQRGFQNAAQAMAAAAPGGASGMAQWDANAVATVLALTGRDDPSHYETTYIELRAWVDGSLDLYKAELHSVLYPTLVHCFLEIVRRGYVDRARAFLERCGAEFMDAASGMREELLALGGIASQQHLEENATANLFLNNRYELHLTSYAFELVFSFLTDDPRRANLLHILNQRCMVKKYVDTAARDSAGGIAKSVTGANGKGSDDPGFVTAAEKSGLLQHELLWGRLPPSLYMIPDNHEIEAADASKKEKDEQSGTGDGVTPMTGVTSANGATAGSGPAGSGSAKKDNAKDAGKDGKGDAKSDGKDDAEEEPHVLPDGTISASHVPLKRYRPKAQGLDTEEDIKARVKLGWRAHTLSNSASENDATEQECVLPSVLCYTFTNTKGGGLNCSAVSADGAQVVGGFGDSSVRLWDARVSGTAGSSAGAGLSGRPARLIGHSGPVYSVDWTRCGRFVLSGSEDGTVRLWTSLHKADLVAYRGHNYPVWSVGFSPLDHYFASGGHDRTARVWSTDRIYPLRILAGHLADVDVVRWHPNCNYVATGSSDRTARLWDVRQGKCVRVFGARGTVHALAFAPDGTTLAVAGDDPTIEVWDIRYANRAQRLAAHSKTVWSLDYSKDGAVLASGSADHSVGLWDASKTGEKGADSKPLARLRTKDTPIHGVRFTRRNLLVACGNFASPL